MHKPVCFEAIGGLSLIGGLSFLMAATFAATGICQDHDRPDPNENLDPLQIIERFAEELGGPMELESIETLLIDCTVTWSGGEYPWTIKLKGSRCFTTQGNDVRQCLSTDELLTHKVHDGNWELMPPEDAWHSVNTFPHPLTVQRWLQGKEDFQYAGQESITNPYTGLEHQVVRLNSIHESGAKLSLGFDKETGLLIHHLFDNLKDEPEQVFFEFAEFAGIHKMSRFWTDRPSLGPEPIIVTVLRSVENPDLPDDLFAIPDTIRSQFEQKKSGKSPK